MANPKLEEGKKAPKWTMESDDDGKISSTDLKGEKYVLYFYPKDNTPGCTNQACDFRDNLDRFTEEGFRIFGVSPDSIKSHEKFRGDHDLNFTLLSDPDHKVAERFGVWREKKNYGKTYMGIVRSTFVVDAEGTLEAIYDNVRAKGHVERIAKDLLS